MTIMKASHRGVKVCGWKPASHLKRVQAIIQARIPMIRPSHPHQGNDRAGRLLGSTLRCCLTALMISGVRQVQMIKV